MAKNSFSDARLEIDGNSLAAILGSAELNIVASLSQHHRRDLHFGAKLFFLNLSDQDMQPFYVKRHADKVPFAFYCFETS